MRERQNKVHKNNPDPLFLSYYRPHIPIASTTVSRWLKHVLKSVGKDVSIKDIQLHQLQLQQPNLRELLHQIFLK